MTDRDGTSPDGFDGVVAGSDDTPTSIDAHDNGRGFGCRHDPAAAETHTALSATATRLGPLSGTTSVPADWRLRGMTVASGVQTAVSRWRR